MKLNKYLVEDFWKTWSFKISALCTALAGLEYMLPALETKLPPHWYMGAFASIMIARAIKQAIDAIKEEEAKEPVNDNTKPE